MDRDYDLVTDTVSDDKRPTWRTPGEACRVVAYRRHLSRTLTTALVVGTILFVINHLDTVLSGKATTGTWVETGLTYLVPFFVANIGILIACHRVTRRTGHATPVGRTQDR